MLADSVKYAVEYLSYYFYVQPAFEIADVEKFSVELANKLYETLTMNTNESEGSRSNNQQRSSSGYDKNRKSQGGGEYILEINIDGRLTAIGK